MTVPTGPWTRPTRSRRPPPLRWLWIWLGFLAGAGGLLALRHAGGDPAEQARALRLFEALAGGSLILVVFLISARRFRPFRMARGLAGWAGVFLVVVAAYALRDDAAGLAAKVASALTPDLPVARSARSLVVGRADNGAFYVRGQVNGAAVRFIIDTGSTDILLSPADAARAGLRPAAGDFSRPSETANGVGYAARAVAGSLAVGPIRLTDVPVSINRAPMGASLLGMPFLRRLESFEVRGDQMLLKGPG